MQKTDKEIKHPRIDYLLNYWDQPNGLLLLDDPTGSGKTTAIVHVIARKILEHFEGHGKGLKPRRIFFCSTQLKNLPVEKLKKVIDSELPIPTGTIISLESNRKALERSFDTIYEHIPQTIRKREYFRNLENDLQDKKLGGNYSQSTLDKIENSLSFLERQFRQGVKEYLRREWRSLGIIKTDDKYATVREGGAYEWVGKIYPSVYLRDAQVAFLSVKKLVGSIDCIVESFQFPHPELTNDGVIIIDEIDSARGTILDHIIDVTSQRAIDPFSLFATIYGALSRRALSKFPRDIKEHSQSYNRILKKDGRGTWYPVEEFYEKVLQDFEEKKNSFHLSLNPYFSNQDGGLGDGQNFIFRELSTHSFMGGRDIDSPIIIANEADGELSIREQERDENGKTILPTDANFLDGTLNSINSSLRLFCSLVTALALNRQWNKAERDSHEGFDRCISIVLGNFIDDRDSKGFFPFLKQVITNRNVRSVFSLSSGRQNNKQVHTNHAISLPDTSRYEEGFQIYDLVKFHAQDDICRVNAYYVDTSPEKMLSALAENCLVLGLSATASFSTVVGNFNYDYLQTRRGVRILGNSVQEKIAFKEYYNDEVIPGFNKNLVKTNISFLQSGGDCLQDFTDLFTKAGVHMAKIAAREIFNLVYGDLVTIDNKKAANFPLQRYFRIAQAYQSFISNKKIHSYLCLLNIAPKPFKRACNSNVLKEIFKILNKASGYKEDSSFEVIVEGSRNFQVVWETGALPRLKNSDKVFVIAAYQTIGTGQNLQYTPPQWLHKKLIRINTRSNRCEKDFDGIYLDQPTHIVPNLTSGPIYEENRFNELLKGLLHGAAMRDSGQITRGQFRKITLGYFRAISGASKFFRDNPLRQGLDFSYNMLIVLYQALGRISRTNWKSPQIYIDVDANLIPVLQDYDLDCPVSFEFSKLIEAAKKIPHSKKKKSKVIRLEEQASLHNLNAFRFKAQLLQSIRFSESIGINHYNSFGEFILSHPTFSQNHSSEIIGLKDFSVKFPTKSNKYTYEGEYLSSLKISFSNDLTFEVSQETARLKELLAIPGVSDFWEKKGYAKRWEPNQFCMTPVVFQSMYKGRLGEAVLEGLVPKLFDQELRMLPEEITEMMDFCSGSENRPIFWDAKHWKESTEKSLEKELSKIQWKQAKAEGLGFPMPLCIIVNILLPEDSNGYRYTVKSTPFGKIVVVPALWDGTQFIHQYISKTRKIIKEYENAH